MLDVRSLPKVNESNRNIQLHRPMPVRRLVSCATNGKAISHVDSNRDIDQVSEVRRKERAQLAIDLSVI
jgi:hypothetical protein